MRNDRIVEAAAALILGVFFVSIQDMSMKTIAGGQAATMAIAIRSAVAVPLLVGVAAFLETPIRQKMNHRLLVARGLAGFGSYLTFILGLAALPFADAVAISFISPIFIALLGSFLLGELLGLLGVVALATGLAGMLIITRPGAAAFNWVVLFPILSAFLYAISQIIARKVADNHGALLMSAYQNVIYLFAAIATALIIALMGVDSGHPSIQFLSRPWQFQNGHDLWIMVGSGVAATVGTTLMMQAYRIAAASRVAVFEYTAILWAPMWGFFIFSEMPAPMTIAGSIVICAAGLMALWQGRRR